jgi:hypothetical protein
MRTRIRCGLIGRCPNATGARDLFLRMAPIVRTTLRDPNISLLDQAGDSPKRRSAHLMRQMRALSFGARTGTGRGRPSREAGCASSANLRGIGLE